jgi:hypothetical protein
MICENLPRYGVIVVVVNVETENRTGISNSDTEISDMFLRKFILYQTNVQIIWKQQNYFSFTEVLCKSVLWDIFYIERIFIL